MLLPTALNNLLLQLLKAQSQLLLKLTLLSSNSISVELFPAHGAEPISTTVFSLLDMALMPRKETTGS